MFPPSKKDELVKKIRELLTTLKDDLDIDIPKKVENTLTNIEILDEDNEVEEENSNSDNDNNDHSDNNSDEESDSCNDNDSDSGDNDDNIKDYEYIFEDDTFKIKSYLINDNEKKSELKAIILSYILENIQPNERIEFIKKTITDKQVDSGWSTIFNIFKK
jgi:hypothetical protein